MGMKVDDNVKQELLESLEKEPTMVLSTAYLYAKSYVDYGEDITKVWTTAVQQASIIQRVRIKAQAEAYDSFEKDYENRLKADLKAILVELQLEIEELDLKDSVPDYQKGADETREYIADLLQQKIDALNDN